MQDAEPRHTLPEELQSEEALLPTPPRRFRNPALGADRQAAFEERQHSAEYKRKLRTSNDFYFFLMV